MYTFFMSSWDAERLGTRYYVCYGGENSSGNFFSETLPLFFLPDSVATQSEPLAIVAALGSEHNRYFLPFDPPTGKHFFAPAREVFQLIGRLRVLVHEDRLHREAINETTNTPTSVLSDGGEWQWFGNAAGVAGVDVGGRVAIDFETTSPGPVHRRGENAVSPGAALAAAMAVAVTGGSAPIGGSYRLSGAGGDAEFNSGGVLIRSNGAGGGAGGGAPSLRFHETQNGRLRVQERVARCTDPNRVMIDRELGTGSLHRGEVTVTFSDGRHERCSIAEYNARVDREDWVGFGRI